MIRSSRPRSSPLAPAVLALVVFAVGALFCGPAEPGPEDCCPCVGEVRTGCEDACGTPGACSDEVDA